MPGAGFAAAASMRILLLTKRRYMGRDVLRDRYGRFYELPLALAANGAEVTVSCLDYYRATGADTPVREGGVIWHAAGLGRNPVAGMYRYYRQLQALVRECRPQILVGASDSFHVILAARLAAAAKLPWCADLYDNFESYGQMRLPGLRPVFRRALRTADAITVVSNPLREFVRRTCRTAAHIEVLENAVPAGIFVPADRAAARRHLNLPPGARLIGTAGSLFGNRDTATLYAAFLELARRDDALYLVLAGRTARRLPPPRHERVIYLGNLPYSGVPRLYAALDVGLVCCRDDAFGRYCFPQKLYEMIACRLPPVAAGVGAVAELLRDHPGCLYRPGDSPDLQRAVTAQLAAGLVPDVPVPDWPGQAVRLLRLLHDAAGA